MWKLVLVGWILGHVLIGETAWSVSPMYSFIFLACTAISFYRREAWLCCILGFITAILLGQWHANSNLQNQLQNRQTVAHSAQLKVQIEQISEQHARSTQQVVHVIDSNTSYNLKAILNNKRFTDNTLQLGHCYWLEGDIKPTQSYAMAGVFDQEKWFLQQNLMGTVLVRHIEETSCTHTPWVWIEKQRLHFRQWIDEQKFKQSGLLLALLTGDESLLLPDTQILFQHLGISHLLAISGPHVLIFAAMMVWFLHHLICWLRPQFYDKFPKNFVFAIPFFCCVLFYCSFVGFEIPAIRTLITTALITLTLFFRQKFSSLSIILLSAGLLLLIAPLSIFSVAFWLSYGSCFILLRVYQTVNQSDGRLVWQFVQSQGKIFVALLPLTILFFQQVAWISPVSNLVAIPIIGVLVVPMEVFAATLNYFSPTLSFPFFYCADWLLNTLVGVLGYLEKYSTLHYIWFTPWQTALLAVGVGILFLPKGVVPRLWAVLCFIAIFIPHETSDFSLSILDVGQGQSIFVQDAQKNILIDTGGSYNEKTFSLAERVLVPYFVHRGVNHLDQVILSHLDHDHSGAFPRLSELMPIHHLMSNEWQQTNIPFQYCMQGQRIQSASMQLEILSPQKEALAHASDNRNETSCVIYISAYGQHFLVMSDTGVQTEAEIMHNYPHLAVDILILGHHGSKFSSSSEFLQFYHPKLAVASAGKDNRYGHPSIEVQQRLAQFGIPLVVTANKGEIRFNLNQGKFETQYYREQKSWLQR